MNLYEKGLQLARQGRYEEAQAHLQTYMTQNPDDGRAWNDAGVVLFTAGRCTEAIACLEHARDLEYDPECADYNLFCAYLAVNRIPEAVDLFEGMCSSGVADERKTNEAVSMLLDRGDSGTAMELLVRARQLRPDLHLDETLEDIRRSRPKIAFFCGGDGDTFLADIRRFVNERYQTRAFEGDSVEKMRELMAWSDISWFEWCTNLAEIGTKLPHICRTIIRLHRYEAYVGWPARINWPNVDTLITVGNPCVDAMLEQQVPGLRSLTRLMTIPNGVNLEKIRFVRRRRGKNIAFVGNMRFVKNPMLLLQCMGQLHKIDPEYRLFIAGKTQDLEVEQYVRHMIDALGLRDHVFLDGWQEDMQRWLTDKHYIVLTSVIESQGMGMLEGMAAGLKPVVHNFPGAAGIYPKCALFNTLDEFCAIIASSDYKPAEYRAFVQDRYSLCAELAQIGKLLHTFERNPVHSATKHACMA